MIYSFFDEDSGNVTFSSSGMGNLSVDLNNINLDDVKFDEDDPENIIHVRLVAWRNRYKQRRAYRKDIGKQIINACSMASNKMVGLMHARGWKKRIKLIFIDKN